MVLFVVLIGIGITTVFAGLDGGEVSIGPTATRIDGILVVEQLNERAKVFSGPDNPNDVNPLDAKDGDLYLRENGDVFIKHADFLGLGFWPQVLLDQNIIEIDERLAELRETPPDVVTVELGLTNPTLSIAIGNEDIGFYPRFEMPLVDFVSGVAVGDLNNDRKAEVVTLHPIVPEVLVWEARRGRPSTRTRQSPTGCCRRPGQCVAGPPAARI